MGACVLHLPPMYGLYVAQTFMRNLGLHTDVLAFLEFKLGSLRTAGRSVRQQQQQHTPGTTGGAIPEGNEEWSGRGVGGRLYSFEQIQVITERDCL